YGPGDRFGGGLGRRRRHPEPTGPVTQPRDADAVVGRQPSGTVVADHGDATTVLEHHGGGKKEEIVEVPVAVAPHRDGRRRGSEVALGRRSGHAAGVRRRWLRPGSGRARPCRRWTAPRRDGRRASGPTTSVRAGSRSPGPATA